MTYNCANEIKEDKETHGEETKATKFRQECEFDKVMDRGIDPTTTLRQKHGKAIGGNGVGDGIGSELHLEGREMGHHDGCEVPIFTEGEQVLLVESVDDVF